MKKKSLSLILVAVVSLSLMCACTEKMKDTVSEQNKTDTISKDIPKQEETAKEYTPETVPVVFNQKTTVGDMIEFTLENKEWNEYLLTSSGAGDSNYDDLGDYFFIMRGTAKNISSGPVSGLNNAKIEVTTDTGAKYYGSMRYEERDNKSFKSDIKALEETKFIIYANIPWNEYHKCKTLKIDINHIIDSSYANKGILYGQYTPYNTYTLTVNK